MVYPTEDMGCDIDLDTVIKVWNKPRLVTVIDRVFDCTDPETGEVMWMIYEFKEGKGKKSKFIIADSLAKIDKGEQKLYLEPADDEHEFFKHPIDPYEDEPGIKKIAKKLGLNYKEVDVEYLWQRIRESHRKHRVFYVLTDAIPIEELKKITSISILLDEAFDDVCGKLDPRLKIYIKIQYVHYDKSLISPKYQRYNPHSIVITSTKAGKTTSSKIVGINVSRSTPAGLIGYSSTQKTQKGIIHNEARPIFVDEFEVLEKDKEVVTCLLGLLEDGEEYIARGDGFYVKTWSAINFLGNPIGDDSRFETDATYVFEHLLSTLSSNAEALGSRIGLILFDNNFEVLKPVETDEEKIRRYIIFLETVQKHVAKMFSVIIRFKSVIDWLNKPIDYYKDHMDVLLNHIELNIELNNVFYCNKLIQFIKGQKEAHKHIRGAALRLAIFEILDDFWQQYCSVNCDVKLFEKRIRTTDLIETLLRLADEKLEYITEINSKSIERILNILKDDRYPKELLKSWYVAQPKVGREFIRGICKAYIEHRSNILVEDMVKQHIKSDRSSYSSSTIFKEGCKKFRDCESWFTVKETSGIKYIEIIDVGTVQILSEIIGIAEVSEDSETSECGDGVDCRYHTDTSDTSYLSSSSASEVEFHEEVFDMREYDKSKDDYEDELDDKDILECMNVS